MNYQQCFLYRKKKKNLYTLENGPFGEIIPVCSKDRIQN